MQQDNEKRGKLGELLLSLAKSQDALQDGSSRAKIYLQLEEIYYTRKNEKPFRHYYSEILSLLIRINQDKQLGHIEILGQNLSVIFNGYQPQNHDEDGNPIDISESIKKLYDHVNLEIQRISYSDMNDNKLTQEETIKAIRKETVDIGSKADVISGRVEELEGKLSQTQKEYVAILGIFAAIVLAFTGGFAFSTSVLENLHSGSIYRVVLVALIIGLVIINILFGLFFYLDRLISTKKEKRIAPLIIANVVIVALIGLTILAWTFSIVEKRNSPTSTSPAGTSATVTTAPPTSSNP